MGRRCVWLCVCVVGGARGVFFCSWFFFVCVFVCLGAFFSYSRFSCRRSSGGGSVAGDQFLDLRLRHRLAFVASEVKQRRERFASRQSRCRVTQLVEQRVAAGIQRRHTAGGRVSQHLRNEVDRLVRRVRPEDLAPRVRLDRRELEVGVALVHGLDLLTRGRAQHLDDLHQLVDARLSREQRLPDEQLGEDAAQRPHVDGGGVVRGTEDELRGTVIPRADVGHVGLSLHQLLGAAEVAQLQDTCGGVDKQVLGLDVAVTDVQVLAMDVVEGPAELVHEELDEDERHKLLVLGEVPGEAVHCVRHVLQDQVQVQLLRLLAVGVEAVLHVDDVAVGQEAHDLELAVLVPLVLQHLLDGHHLARLHNLGEEHDTEGAMADHALRAVGDGLGHSTRARLRHRRIRRLHRQVLGTCILRHPKDSAQGSDSRLLPPNTLRGVLFAVLAVRGGRGDGNHRDAAPLVLCAARWCFRGGMGGGGGRNSRPSF
eukprot:Rhum_TRINITY_DN14356_c14_g1::Rhum_TRINITY_DN14356_c14_g1_i1::g.84606::m.84606